MTRFFRLTIKGKKYVLPLTVRRRPVPFLQSIASFQATFPLNGGVGAYIHNGMK